jgi:5-methylcytosine-specific restriction endonuclease McrA
MPTGIYIRKPITEETRNKMRESRKKQVIVHSEETKKKISEGNKGKQAGKLNASYKHGLSKDKNYLRLLWQKSHASNRHNGDISVETIQLVYEDNIKKYGTLTCYLCELSIEFGKDVLEHKTPSAKGGTNCYNNLAIAHRSCNSNKGDKTEEEFKAVTKVKY